MTLTPNVEAFWQRYLHSRPDRDYRPARPANVADFGNSKEMADQLGGLVLAGVKTATSSLAWEYEVSGEALPAVGDVEIIVDGSGEPLCVTEITEVTIRPFNTINEAFAFDYGEGDQTLAWWRRALWEYYSAECQKLAREPDETMPLVCLRFRLLYAGVN